MAKSSGIPQNIAATQYVEEVFRNIKNAPENKKNETMREHVRHLKNKREDVHTLEKGSESHGKKEDEDSMYRDDVVEISSKKANDDKQEKSEEEIVLKEDEGIEYIEDGKEEEPNSKGRLLDIEG